VHDPVVAKLPDAVSGMSNVDLETDLEAALEGADAVVLATRWEHYRRVPELIAKLDPAPVFVDGRRMFDRQEFARYAGIGA
jgi:UDPglucose 6-dehydrogenase/GDP-mannose 6-dehydrogenase